MVLLDEDNDRSVTRSLHQRVVRYSAIGIFGISSAIAAVSFLPLYLQQRQQQERWLTDIVETRAAATDLYLQNTRAIAQQITSRTGIREVLEEYNEGRITLQELQTFSTDKLQEALQSSQDIVAISQYDAEQNLVVEVGLPFQPPRQKIDTPPTSIHIELLLSGEAENFSMIVMAPIRNPHSGAIVGTDVLQFKGRSLQRILHDPTGLEQTGKVYLQSVATSPSNHQSPLVADQSYAMVSDRDGGQFWHRDNMITAAVPLQTTDTLLLISMDRREVYGPFYRRLMPILLLIAALGTLQTIAILLLLRPLSGRVLVHSTKIAEINKQLQAACEQSPVSILITDTKGRIQYVNPKFQELTGYALAEVMGHTPRIMQSGSMPISTYQELWRTIESGRTWHGELLNRKKNGEMFWESVKIAPVKHENGKITHYVGIKEDVTLRRQAQDLLKYQAQHDMLTGLFNRTYALELLASKLEKAAVDYTQVAVFFIDLNGFKAINDTFGHAAGDHLLIVMAKRLQNSLRASDLIARLGGDEFLVAIAGDQIREQAQSISQKILEALAQPAALQNEVVNLSGSLGIALYPQNSQQAAELISQADQAMYVAKQRQAPAGLFFEQTEATPVACRDC